jgi:hypothetical protein
MTIEAFLETAWDDHADRPEEVADRLIASLHLVQTPEHISAYTRLVTHVFGEHLGQWDRGIGLLEALRGLPAFDGDGTAAGVLTRSIATLRYASASAASAMSVRLRYRASMPCGFSSKSRGKRGSGANPTATNSGPDSMGR